MKNKFIPYDMALTMKTKMSSFNQLKKQLTTSDVETIMTDMGYNWEDDYDDYEEFINAIGEYLKTN